MAISLDMLQTSLYLSFGIIVVSLLFQLYMLYLNWKQSRVKNQMGELIIVSKQIRNKIDTLIHEVEKK